TGLLFHQYFPAESWAGNLPAVAKDNSYVVMESNSDQAYDLYELYYGIGNFVKEAQKADVLILGNSKPFFAFRSESVRVFIDKTGIKVFNLSVPYGDGYGMAKAFIDRLHLSPSVIIIDENHFFGSALSPYGNETIKMGYWQALVRVAEHDISWFLRSELHQLFPRLGLGKIYGSVPGVLLRSIQTGCLAMGNYDENLVPVASHDYGQESLSPDELKNAVQFTKEMKGRGIKIILTSVPYGTDDMDHLDKWIRDPEKRILVSRAEEHYEKVDETARILGLPLIVINSDGMETFDGRHLDEKSGLKFSNLFFDGFLKRPEIQTLLKVKK
ncbi:MAG TPA: hypothetical protein VN963_07185, partial [bacterium]|nr:hypothetical protein [bacterium]